MDEIKLESLIDDDRFQLYYSDPDGILGGYSELMYKGPKPQNLQEAFEISLKKWELAGKLIEHSFVGDGGPDTCGFCLLSFEYNCEGCPIKAVGYPVCRDTPYEDYCTAVGFERRDEARKAAQAEYRLIKRLQEMASDVGVSE